VSAVADRMRAVDIGFMPVVNEQGQVIGTLTDRDITVRVVARGLSPLQTTVGDVMTRGAVVCDVEDPLSLVEQRMARHQVSRIVCVDPYGRPVGVISLADIAACERGEEAGDVLRTIKALDARPRSMAELRYQRSKDWREPSREWREPSRDWREPTARHW
jgi:signal-transduction protein with cAMP-binding, CBS, and nucleotidyltransferase domain